MLRSVRLAVAILNLRFTIILILRHLSRRPRPRGWLGTLRTNPASRWATMPSIPGLRPARRRREHPAISQRKRDAATPPLSFTDRTSPPEI